MTASDSSIIWNKELAAATLQAYQQKGQRQLALEKMTRAVIEN